MCLDSLDDVKRFKNIEREGYKAFRVTDERVSAVLLGNCKHMPLGVWLKEEDYRAGFEQDKTSIVGVGETPEDGWETFEYPIGFHILKTKKAVKEWFGSPFKVKFRKVVARGQQFKQVCYVAKEMMIIEEVK